MVADRPTESRRTYKAVVSNPRLVPGPGEAAEEEGEGVKKQTAPQEGMAAAALADGKQKRPGDPAGGVKKKTKKK